MAELRTRKPTGRPSWPILLLAGAEKAGKSYTAAVATSSTLVGRSYWVTIGEDQPDEYGPLGRFEIVEHNGSYKEILATLKLAGEQPSPSTGVPLLIVDSMTRLWNLLTDEAQERANTRAAAKARKFNKPVPDEESPISMDLWNEAKAKWVAVMDAIRAFPGPVILTARLDEVTVLDDSGRPTTQRKSKVQAEKSLAYDVGAVVEMPARGETWISGVRSVKLQLAERTRTPEDFTVDWFWRRLGLGEVETGPRDHNAPKVAGTLATPAEPPSRPVPEASGPGRVYDPSVADQWFAAVTGATHLGPKHTEEGDGLRAVFLRAKKAGVLDNYIDDPAASPDDVFTIGQLLASRAKHLPESPAVDEAPPPQDDEPSWARSPIDEAPAELPF